VIIGYDGDRRTFLCSFSAPAFIGIGIIGVQIEGNDATNIDAVMPCA